jgi:hypothetical protein
MSNARDDKAFLAARRAMQIEREEWELINRRQNALERRMDHSEAQIDEIRAHLGLTPVRGDADPVSRMLCGGQRPHA